MARCFCPRLMKESGGIWLSSTDTVSVEDVTSALEHTWYVAVVVYRDIVHSLAYDNYSPLWSPMCHRWL